MNSTATHTNLYEWNFSYMFLPIIFLLWYVVQYHWERRHLYKLSGKLPGPKAWPIIGSSLEFVGSSADTYNNLMKIFGSYPDLFKIWFGLSLIYGVSKPEYLEKVLTSPKALAKKDFYRYAEPLLGHGLFSAPVPLWKRHRKIIMPAFNQRTLDAFVEVFSRQSTIMGVILEKYVGKGEFDLHHVISKYGLDIICETAMGVKMDAQTTDSVFMQWVDRLLEIMFLRMSVIWYHYDFIFKWTQLHRDESELLQKFHSLTRNIVRERRIAFDHKKIGKGKAFLDLLLEASQAHTQNQLTDEEIRDEVNTFVIAGSDTTASSSGFIFLMLGMHSEIQERIYEEILEVSGGTDCIKAEDLPRLRYTERMIKETLRLFPVAPYIVRSVEDDLRLTDDLVLAKGSAAILGIMQVHRNGEFWPDPLKFDPDRFLPEEAAKRPPFSYLPFSGGPRSCVGPKYAMMALKTMVATTVRKYKISTTYKAVEEIELKTNVVLKARDGFKISVELREGCKKGDSR